MKVFGVSASIVDVDEKNNDIKITFEFKISRLRTTWEKLLRLEECMPAFDPREWKSSYYHIGLFWWIEEIRFPDDCPFEPLRGFSLKRGRDFYQDYDPLKQPEGDA